MRLAKAARAHEQGDGQPVLGSQKKQRLTSRSLVCGLLVNGEYTFRSMPLRFRF